MHCLNVDVADTLIVNQIDQCICKYAGSIFNRKTPFSALKYNDLNKILHLNKGYSTKKITSKGFNNRKVNQNHGIKTTRLRKQTW